MTESILKSLETIEKENNIRTLYAVESDSRARGFASPDSDYDVRFDALLSQEPEAVVTELLLQKQAVGEKDLMDREARL